VVLAAASGSNTAGGLIVAAPSYVFTISRVAEMLGEDEQWLQTIADDMEPEDGCLTVCGTDDLSTTAFTPFGIESLKELMPMYRREAGEG
jgi:hypothetical protein